MHTALRYDHVEVGVEEAITDCFLLKLGLPSLDKVNSTMSSTQTHRALVVLEKGKTTISADKPIPSVSEDGILVKVKAVTLNPTDWKVRPIPCLWFDFQLIR